MSNELVNTEEETPKEPLAFGIKQALSEAGMLHAIIILITGK